MTISGNRGSFGVAEERAHTDHHPVIIGNGQVLADNGEYPIGLIVKRDENDLLVPYTGPADTDLPAGVIDEPCDTAEDGSAMVILHGTVRGGLLKIGTAGDPATADDIRKLATIGIFAV
jgi:hypothetical protein